MDQIIAVLTPEQRAVLQPHIDALHAAEESARCAQLAISTAVRAFYPDAEGAAFDSRRCALVRKGED